MSRYLRELRNKIFRKDYAKLGDSIVNCVFSIVLTLLTEKPTGIKVSNKVLREAYKVTKLGSKLGLERLPRDVNPEDVIEALVGALWLEGKLDINDSISTLYKRMRHHKLVSEKYLGIKFTELLIEMLI